VAYLKRGADDVQTPIEYAMMAAANIMGIDPMSISNAKKCEDWPEWDSAIQWELAHCEEVST